MRDRPEGAEVLAAAGTAGQRCTTMRRVIAHADIAEELIDNVGAAALSDTDPPTDCRQCHTAMPGA